MRWPHPERALALVPGLALLAMSGCALDAGDPWGVIEPTLAVSFEVPASRMDGGRLKTSRDYRVQIERVELEVASLTLLASPEGGAAFDPQDPPEGYSLCHNGHCHAADGRLVDYEDIARELAGGQGAAALLTLGGGEVELALGGRAEVALNGCELREACWVLEPSGLSGAAVAVSGGRVVGRAFDARIGEGARLPVEGVAFDATLGAGGLTAALDERFGPDEALTLELDLVVELPAAMFDEVAWDSADDAAIEAAVNGALREEGGLGVSTRRR